MARQAGSPIEHRLDTGPRTEHPSRQYRALFRLLHGQRHQPLRQAHLTRFQSGLGHQAPFRSSRLPRRRHVGFIQALWQVLTTPLQCRRFRTRQHRLKPCRCRPHPARSATRMECSTASSNSSIRLPRRPIRINPTPINQLCLPTLVSSMDRPGLLAVPTLRSRSFRFSPHLDSNNFKPHLRQAGSPGLLHKWQHLRWLLNMQLRSTDRLNRCLLTLVRHCRFNRFRKESLRTSRHRLNRFQQVRSTRRRLFQPSTDTVTPAHVRRELSARPTCVRHG